MVGVMVYVCLAASVPPAQSTPVNAAVIMREVGIRQDCALAARSGFVYRQKLLMRMHRGNDKLAREERREYTVTPSTNGSEKMLASFQGKYAVKGKEVTYDKPGYSYKGTDVDGQVLDGLAKDLTEDKESRDGLAKDMFPLSTPEQGGYTFRLKNTESYRGRKMYRIAFFPRGKSDDIDAASGPWKGEALIDAEEFQPVMVETSMANKIPFLVKTMLGTNIQGLGFSVSYQKFAPGVWFPVTYGSEFHVKVLFLYTRNISVSLENSGFQRTGVTTNIRFDTPTE